MPAHVLRRRIYMRVGAAMIVRAISAVYIYVRVKVSRSLATVMNITVAVTVRSRFLDSD